jgi:hypothetical protein
MEPLERTPAPDRGVGWRHARKREEDAVACTWCGSSDVERIGEWGPQLLTEQYVCRACRTPFEWVRKR